MTRDWADWHRGYDDRASSLSSRLAVVQARLSQALTAAQAGPIRLVSLCAGQGRDVFGVLPGHPRRSEVSAVLVECNPQIAAAAAGQARSAGLANVEVRSADAGLVSSYADALPADVLLLCGIFGNVSDDDIRATVAAAPALSAPGATVIWTRHRRPPDLTPRLRSWFGAAGFDEVAFEVLPSHASVGVHRLALTAGDRPAGKLPAVTPPAVTPPAGRLFAFTSAR